MRGDQANPRERISCKEKAQKSCFLHHANREANLKRVGLSILSQQRKRHCSLFFHNGNPYLILSVLRIGVEIHFNVRPVVILISRGREPLRHNSLFKLLDRLWALPCAGKDRPVCRRQPACLRPQSNISTRLCSRIR